MGSAKIYGKIATGPTSGFSVSSGVTVGSLAWVNGGNTGVQPGWSRNDLNISLPDAPPLPTGTYVNLPSPGNNVVLNAGGGTVRYVATSSQYSMSSSNSLVITNGTVIIDAQSGVNVTGQRLDSDRYQCPTNTLFRNRKHPIGRARGDEFRGLSDQLHRLRKNQQQTN